MNRQVKSPRHKSPSPPGRSGNRVLLVATVAVAFVAGFAAERLNRSAKAKAVPQFLAAASVSVPAPPPVVLAPRLAVRPVAVAVEAPLPRAVLPKPEPVAVAPVPRPGAAPRKPADRFAVHTLPTRIDPRPAEELEKDLLGMREVALDAPSDPRRSADVISAARRKNDPFAPAVVLAVKGRADLAGLPFRTGADAVLSRDRAESMNTMSRQLRETFQKSLDRNDPRPDVEKLHAALTSEGRKSKAWSTPEAVPCIQQVLQAEGQPVRRMSCELLRDMPVAAAADALVKWAVFDTDPEIRAAAVDTLRDRDRKEVSRLLTAYVRYPWPRAVEHACEALVALGCGDAVPQLAAAYDQPDPDAPFEVDLPGEAGGVFRREVVRVNHLKNCLLCHAPSFNQTDLIRAAVPEQSRSLPPPTSPSYYSPSNGNLITAEMTYLRQDFSVVQPVVNPGQWPTRQRFDYVVAVRREYGMAANRPALNSPYQRAVGVAIKELTGRDPERDLDWLAAQQKLAGPADDGRVGDAARSEVLATNPAALVAVKQQEFTRPPTRMGGAELDELAIGLKKAHGSAAARLALIAYLDPLTRDPDAVASAKAARLLAAARDATDDDALGWALRKAAREID